MLGSPRMGFNTPRLHFCFPFTFASHEDAKLDRPEDPYA